MDRLWEVAPPGIWAFLGLASVFLMTGFVLLSHTLVRRKAYGDGWNGLLARGLLETTVRVGVASLLAGGALWAAGMDAAGSTWIWGLSAAAALVAGFEAFADLR